VPASRSLSAAPGSPCPFLANPGCPWLRLAASLPLLDSPGFLAATGWSWMLLSPPWVDLPATGCSWRPLGTPGCPWLLPAAARRLSVASDGASSWPPPSAQADPGCSWLLAGCRIAAFRSSTLKGCTLLTGACLSLPLAGSWLPDNCTARNPGKQLDLIVAAPGCSSLLLVRLAPPDSPWLLRVVSLLPPGSSLLPTAR